MDKDSCSLIVTCSPIKTLSGGNNYRNPKSQDERVRLSGFIRNICTEQIITVVRNLENIFLRWWTDGRVFLSRDVRCT